MYFMIARISKGDFLKGAVLYNETKVQEGEASAIDIKNIRNVEEGEFIESSEAINMMIHQCWKKEEDGNTKLAIKDPVFSCSLNLNQDDLDKLKTLREQEGEEAENDFYRKIANRYMDGMGYGKQPYIVYKHEDIERTHIHIISIRVDENQKKINDSNEKRRSERVRKEIAKEFGLSEEGEKKTSKMTQSEINTRTEKRADFIQKSGAAINELAKLNPDDPANLTKLRHKISNILKFVDENYKPKDITEYNKILSQFHIKCNKIDTLDKDGRRINGCQFGVINAKGDFVSHLIKGGQVNEKFTMPKLETKFALASGMKTDMRKDDAFSKKYITEQIKSILEAPREISMDYLCDVLNKRGVEANIVRDNDEKAVGINFIDNLNGKVFTGSSLGREYTYGNLSKSIENHNAKLSYLEKDAFTQATKFLNNKYNDTRKESYFLESDLIKDLPSKKEDFTQALQKDLQLTDKQAEKCFDTFCRFKIGQLPSLEAKEDAYQQSQIVTALKFASKMESDQQGRVDLLHKMGISVSEKNGTVIYESQRKPDVWLSYIHVKEMDNGVSEEEPIKRAAAPSGNLTPLNKTERQFVKDIAEGGDGSEVKGNWIKMLDLLDKDTKGTAINDNIVKMFSAVVAPVRTKEFKESRMLESEFIKSMDKIKTPIVEKATHDLDISRETAEAIFDKYKAYQNKVVLPDVETREEKAVVNRVDMSLRFASRIEDPAKKTEFLKRMEISVAKVGNEMVFSYDRKPNFALSAREINARTGLAVTPQTFIFADLKDVQPFSKKERDFVKDYLSGENLMDGRYSTALHYLSKADQDNAKKVGIGVRVAKILDAVNTRTADDMVKALLYRGFVIHPVKENGETSYKVSRFNNKSAEIMTTLPKELSDKLNNSNFAQVYPNIKEQLLAKGVYGTAKLVAVMKISRAGDFNDEQLLKDTINDVAKVNKVLASKMEEAATPTKDGIIDYGRVARLVAEYNGEKDIKLPPTTIQSVKREEKIPMETIINELRHGNTLETAIRLMQDENTEEETKQGNKRKL